MFCEPSWRKLVTSTWPCKAASATGITQSTSVWCVALCCDELHCTLPDAVLMSECWLVLPTERVNGETAHSLSMRIGLSRVAYNRTADKRQNLVQPNSAEPNQQQ